MEELEDGGFTLTADDNLPDENPDAGELSDDGTNFTVTAEDEGEADGAEDAGAEGEDAPIDYKAQFEELQAKYREVEDIIPYAPFAREAAKLGTPEQVQQALAQQHQASWEGQLQAHEDRGRSVAQQVASEFATETGLEPEDVAPLAERLGDILGPIARKLAELEPIQQAWQQQTQTSALDREIATLKGKYAHMDEESVRREYQQGRNGELEAVRTHTRYETLAKAAGQNAAIDNMKAGTGQKPAPRVPSARGGVAPRSGGKFDLPDPIAEPKAFEEAWKRMTGR